MATIPKSISYLAGLFDGEGSFSIQIGLRHYIADRPSMYADPSMSVNLYYGHEVLDNFVVRFGGKIYAYQRCGEARGFRWHLGRKLDVLKAARILEPHLEIKKDIAQRFIQALMLFPENTGQSRKKGERKWDVETSVAIAEIALTLNPPRARKSNKTLEYLETLREYL